jgi:hypothetical protein
VNVIGAGFGRTGTTSLKAALEDLGFGPAYHMTEVFTHPAHVRFWEAARRGEPVDWEAFLSGYGVAVDWPACAFYEEPMEAVPGAKVVLTVRDPDRWYESMRSTIYEIRRISSGSAKPVLSFAGLFAPGIAGIVRLADDVVWRDTFQNRFDDRRHAIETFRRHNEEVLHRVPPERLLVYDVREGWAPLCAFFGVEIPDKPFPHLNDTREMRRRLLGLVVLSALPPVLLATGLIAALTLLIRRARPHKVSPATARQRRR